MASRKVRSVKLLNCISLWLLSIWWHMSHGIETVLIPLGCSDIRTIASVVFSDASSLDMCCRSQFCCGQCSSRSCCAAPLHGSSIFSKGTYPRTQAQAHRLLDMEDVSINSFNEVSARFKSVNCSLAATIQTKMSVKVAMDNAANFVIVEINEVSAAR